MPGLGRHRHRVDGSGRRAAARRARLGGEALAAAGGDGFTFVQISDSHIGFKRRPTPTRTATLQQAIDQIAKTAGAQPAMMVHTGDVGAPVEAGRVGHRRPDPQGRGLDTHYIPGEHDVIGDDGKAVLRDGSGKGRRAGRLVQLRSGGVHFVALINVFNFKPGDRRARSATSSSSGWRRTSSGTAPARRSSSSAHVPLWPIYPQWGWGTDDGARRSAI